MDLRRQMQERAMAGASKPPGPDKDRLRKMYGNRNVDATSKNKMTPAQRLLGQDRKYFDSGDWVLSKAGKTDRIDTATVGSEHPVPEKIPHLSSPINAVQQHHHPQSHLVPSASSPVKETSFLSQETKAEDIEKGADTKTQPQQSQASGSGENLPVRPS